MNGKIYPHLLKRVLQIARFAGDLQTFAGLDEENRVATAVVSEREESGFIMSSEVGGGVGAISDLAAWL